MTETELDRLARLVGPTKAILLDARNRAPTFVPFQRDPHEAEEARAGDTVVEVPPAFFGSWRRGA